MNRQVLLALLATLLSTLALTASAQAPERERYIVVLNPGAGAPAAVAEDIARQHSGAVGFIYEYALRGFSITLPRNALTALQRDPRINYVETDDPVGLFTQTIPTGVDRVYEPATNNTSASGLSVDGLDDYRVDADIAIIDTGIDYQHSDLNVIAGTNCTYLSGSGPPWMRSAYCVDGLSEGDDDHYHGTHVAGTSAALDNGLGVVGVAPGARLWAVKVLDSSGSGYESNVVAGIDWVVANAAEIEVANMSLGGSGYSQAEQDAINTAHSQGVVFVVAAGNSDADAGNYSPAGLENLVTVSALADFNGRSGGNGSPTCRDDQDDTLADFSNWGSKVEIAAPGVCITSTYPIEHGEYGTISGTSMASPHVAGAAGLLASGANAPQDGAQVDSLISTLLGAGNYDWTDDSGDGIHEPLLDVTGFTPSLAANGDGGGGNTAPTASFTYVCTDLTCDFDASGSSDSEGSLASYDWNFGDSTTGTGVTISHSYAAGGTYTVTLTVTDQDGAIDSQSQDVSVSTETGGGFSLAVTGYKVKGLQKADLQWEGATSTQVDVIRDGSIIATTGNDGLYTDNIDRVGGGSYLYQVCEQGTSTCSNEATVTF